MYWQVGNVMPGRAQSAIIARVPDTPAGERPGKGSFPMSAEQQRWLAALYEANFAVVFKRCNAILKSGEDAADAAHEVFLIALNSLAPDTEEKPARAWLLTVAHNHCLDLLRRRKRFGRALLTLGADHDALGDLEAAVVDRDFVDGLLKQLSLRERLALWQSAVERRSLADIATGLQLSYAAAAQVVHRARLRAVRLAASVAAILALLRFPRVARRVLARMASFRTEAESLLAAHRALALAALPVIAALSIQSSTASSTSPGPNAAVATSGVASNPAGAAVPGGLSSLLAPLQSATDRQGIAGRAGLVAPTGLPSVATPTLPSLADGLGSLPPLPVPTAVPSLLPSPSMPPIASIPPTPSLPPVVP
jgi:RNA polymerase sigma-70 factor, ECF subfamily